MVLKTVFFFISGLFIIFNSNSSEIVASRNEYKLDNLELQAGINLLGSVVEKGSINAETKKNIATKLLNDKIIEKLAKKEDLDSDPLLQIEMRSILVNAYVKKHYDIEAIAKENYSKAVDLIKDKKVYTLSHIMLTNEAEADKLYSQIKNSGKKWKQTFKQLARTKSTDTVTGKNSGFVGTTSEMKLPADFAEQIKNKPTGEPLKPFQTKLGFHIVVIEKIEPMPIESYDKVKNIFIANAVQEQINKITKEQTGGQEMFFNIKD